MPVVQLVFDQEIKIGETRMSVDAVLAGGKSKNIDAERRGLIERDLHVGVRK